MLISTHGEGNSTIRLDTLGLNDGDSISDNIAVTILKLDLQCSGSFSLVLWDLGVDSESELSILTRIVINARVSLSIPRIIVDCVDLDLVGCPGDNLARSLGHLDVCRICGTRDLNGVRTVRVATLCSGIVSLGRHINELSLTGLRN